MLLRFSATNYKSLYHKQELSMVAQLDAQSSSRNQSLVHETSGIRMVPYALIYGANASGKSNLIASLSFLRMAIIASHLGGGPKTVIRRDAFLLNATASNEPTELEIDFTVQGQRFNYGFKTDGEKFLEEWLYQFPSKRAVRLFHRHEDTPINFGPSLKGANKAIAQLVRHNSLFLSAAAQNNHPILTAIYQYFLSFDFQNMTQQVGYSIPEEIDVDNILDRRVVDFLREVGTGVSSARLKPVKRSEGERDRLKELRAAVREASEASNNLKIEVNFSEPDALQLGHTAANGEFVFFDLDIESSGTRGLLSLMTAVFKTLDEGGIIVVDEIDASVHTQVCEAILNLFADERSNPNGAQLIATTHDTNLLCSDTIKRDQIWFAEKNLSGETVIFPLTDFKPREGDNFQKGYLKGRFGAIPFSGNLSGLFKTETAI